MRPAILAAGAGAVIAIAVGAFSLLGRREAPGYQGRIFRIGFDGAPPLSEIGPGGQPIGLAVALLREAAHRRRIQIQWVALPGVSPDHAITSGQVDIWP